MTVVEVLVGLRPDVLDDVADPQSQLVLNGWDPGVHVQLEDRPRGEEVQLAKLGRQHRQPVALEVQLAQARQLANLLSDLRKKSKSEQLTIFFQGDPINPSGNLYTLGLFKKCR